MKEEQIRQFNGQIIGIIETDSSGNKTARDFPSRVILGYYVKDKNQTIEFPSIRIVAWGDVTVDLIYKYKNKDKGGK